MNKCNNLPKHIAFIMDGNGRWAEKRGLTRSEGHLAGVKAMKEIIAFCNEDISVISFFAFSKENWSRPKAEVQALFSIIERFLDKESNNFLDNGIALRFVGDLDALPPSVGDRCKAINTRVITAKTTVCIFINYGGKDDIINACNLLIKSGKQNINQQDFLDSLYTKGLPEPDLVIRTGGEKRLSNFMLFQLAYSEFVFLDCYWPDMDKNQMKKTLEEFGKRKRRFGA